MAVMPTQSCTCSSPSFFVLNCVTSWTRVTGELSSQHEGFSLADMLDLVLVGGDILSAPAVPASTRISDMLKCVQEYRPL